MLVAKGAYGKTMDLSDLITPYGVIPALKASGIIGSGSKAYRHR
jgi:hypothetical protein